MSTDRIRKLHHFLDVDPNDSFSRFALALEHLKLENTETSRSHFEYIRDHDPQYVGVYYHLGKLYQNTDESEKAMKTFKTGLSVAQELKDFHAAGELEEALNELTTDE